ncbi:DUF4097 family beta strand repeat-containing protein [uncultured Croceitalea sp.]|uniref:DUF4097 family beta strand repeat-containing protein n=1 Tax=uncultured Croceitalea sp. TaxID=1798908 RepID=UPI0033058F8C
MRLSIPTYLLICFAHTIVAQKVIRKTIVQPHTQFIQIDTKNCYRTDFYTVAGNELKVQASIEGEYAKDLVVKIEEDGANVRVSADFLPNFIAPNDKLSAHKVISISLHITVPEYSDLSVYGTNCRVTGSGQFRSLNVTLADGDCILSTKSETTTIKTQSGNITVHATEGKIEGKSIYGTVNIAKLPEGDLSYVLQSIEGDIVVNNTK